MVNTRRRGGNSGRGQEPSSVGRPANRSRSRGRGEQSGISANMREAIAEEVRRALVDTLPGLLGPRVEREQERERGEFSEVQSRVGGERPVRNVRPVCTFKEFMNCKPKEFNGTTSPVEALTWVNHIEKMFRTSKCEEEDKVEYATNLLRDRAQHWWDVTSNTMGVEEIRTMTWEEFKVRFNEEYCSQVAVRQLEESFMQLRQGSKSVLDYTGEFNEKARFAEHQVNPESRKVERYLWGLKTEIREFVKSAKLTTFRAVVDAAVEREHELIRQRDDGVWRGDYQSSKRKREEPREWERKKSPPKRSEKIEEEQWCSRCQKKHSGNCEVKTCFRCGQTGHMVKDCMETRPKCYNCGQLGHVRKDCPKLKEQSGMRWDNRRKDEKDDRKDVRKQAYQMTVRDLKEDDTGITFD